MVENVSFTVFTMYWYSLSVLEMYRYWIEDNNPVVFLIAFSILIEFNVRKYSWQKDSVSFSGYILLCSMMLWIDYHSPVKNLAVNCSNFLIQFNNPKFNSSSLTCLKSNVREFTLDILNMKKTILIYPFYIAFYVQACH